MTLSVRALMHVAVLATTLTAGVYFAGSSTSGEQRGAIERRDLLPRSTPAQVASQSQEVTASLPIADARTLLKYGYLLEAAATTDAAAAELLALLQSREEAARTGIDASASDSAVESRLDPACQAIYRALRDSDAEQRALGDFAGGLAQHAPLDAAQRRELLFAKLRHKQQYALMLAQSGIERAGLSAEERGYAHSLLAGALRDYRDAYLEEMRAHLNPEQFRLLSDFERTEFDLELQRLQQSINER